MYRRLLAGRKKLKDRFTLLVTLLLAATLLAAGFFRAKNETERIAYGIEPPCVQWGFSFLS